MNEVEEFAASLFERLAPAVTGRDVGPRTWRNGEDGSGLTVDWSYDDSDPPAALEVTALHGPGERQTISELNKKLQPELSGLAEGERLGQWLVVVEVGSNVKRLIEPVGEVLRRGESIRVGEYTSDELIAGDAIAITGLHRKLKGVGLVEAIRIATATHRVDCMVIGGGPEVTGFTAHLEEALASNSRKLQLDGYESHLAVVVFDFQLSRLSERTPVPPFRSVDYLWVIHGWPGPQDLAEVWAASAGADGWSCRPWS